MSKRRDYGPIPFGLFDDRRFLRLSWDLRGVYLAVLAVCSYRGRFDRDPLVLARHVGTLDIGGLSERLAELEALGMLEAWEVDGREVGEVVGYHALAGLPAKRLDPKHWPEHPEHPDDPRARVGAGAPGPAQAGAQGRAQGPAQAPARPGEARAPDQISSVQPSSEQARGRAGEAKASRGAAPRIHLLEAVGATGTTGPSRDDLLAAMTDEDRAAAAELRRAIEKRRGSGDG